MDIGEKNMALCKERIDLEYVERIKGEVPSYSYRYDKNGESTPDFKNFLMKLSLGGTTEFMRVLDITSDDDKKIVRKRGFKRVIGSRNLCKLTNFLEDMNENGMFEGIDYILIEKQLPKATNNFMLMAHVRAYFTLLFLDFIPIVIYSAVHKTKVLGAPKKVWNEKKGRNVKMTKYQRKKYASDTAFNIFTGREDFDSLASVFGKKKTDDVSDCLLMAISFIFLVWVDNKGSWVFE